MRTRDVKWVVVSIALAAAKTQSVQTKQVSPIAALAQTLQCYEYSISVLINEVFAVKIPPPPPSPQMNQSLTNSQRSA